MPALPSPHDVVVPLSNLRSLLPRKLPLNLHSLLPRQGSMLGTNPTTSSPQNHPNSPHDNKKTNPVIPIAACLGVVGFFLIVAAFIVFARRSRRVSHKPSRSDVNVNVSKEWPSHPSSQQHGAVMYHPQGKMRGYQELGELGKGAREKTRWQRRKEAPLPATPPPPPPPKSGGGGLGVSYGKG